MRNERCKSHSLLSLLTPLHSFLASPDLTARSGRSPRPVRAGCPARTPNGRRPARCASRPRARRSEEHTSELQSLMRISYAVFCLNKHKKKTYKLKQNTQETQ